ncbi:methyltransferase domain-containing protein [Cohnella endophytica]|uniref:Methyltransferase domain-containing protein n=1 Tax=Cohnella endophytica TaxID=2419778 RepID=A0A494XPA9_9BACL|nr:MerR family transcriptional regulator [Cohnella endophytica]RKP51642.1 methyltransferase domain-containing protein [Cohnella endophytica]
MRITEVANKLNISPRAIRFYEEKGLLSPAKHRDNQYRDFSEQDVWRLQTVISLREAGMPIADIRSALAGMGDNDAGELQYYLELQRSVMMSEWLQIKQVIETTERMIALVKSERSLPLEHIFRLAEASKELREHRGNWQDKWDFDLLASTHDERVAENQGNYADYDRALDLIAERVRPKDNELGLDIGTGTGNLAARFKQAGARMSGVDQSKEMLRLCQVKHPGLETRVGNFLALPYLEEQFDFVVSSFAFHHLGPEQQLLSLDEMKRVLKSNGRIGIADLMVSGIPADSADSVASRSQPPECIDLDRLLPWFADNGFRADVQRVNEWLHVLCAYKEVESLD